MASRILRSSVLSIQSTNNSISSRPFTSSSSAWKASKPLARANSVPSRPIIDGERPQRILSFKTRSGTSSFKTFLPVTPSLRQLRQPISEHLHKGDPHRDLTIAKRSTGGRNNTGRITTRSRGGGHKRRIRLVDFVRKETGEQEVMRIEYDPGRSAHIALIKHKVTADLSYILAPATLREGDTVQSFRSGLPSSFMTQDETLPMLSTNPAAPQSVLPAPSSSSSLLSGILSPASTPYISGASVPTTSSPAVVSITQTVDLGILRSLAIKPGNCLPIRLIPVGTIIHGITLSPHGPAILARSAGASARIISASSVGGKHAQVKLDSGEVRLVLLTCMASIGSVSNADHQVSRLSFAPCSRFIN